MSMDGKGRGRKSIPRRVRASAPNGNRRSSTQIKETNIRVWHLTVLAGVGLALAGCGTASSPKSAGGGDGGDSRGAKLENAIVGKWEGKDGENKISYDF